MANDDYVNVQQRWYSDRCEWWVSSPDGWKMMRSEPIARVPFVQIALAEWPWKGEPKSDD